MTIASDDPRKAGPFTCNGATVTFAFGFKIFSASTDLAVILADSSGAETDLAYSADYSVIMNADQNANPGGSITTTATYATGYTITVESAVPATQNTSIPSPSAFSPSVAETAWDRGVALILDNVTKLNRTLRGPRSDADEMNDMPPAATRALHNLYFDASGQPAVGSSVSGTTISSAMDPVVTAATLAAARNYMGNQFAAHSNIGISASANAGALTITLVGEDGNALSTTNKGVVSVFVNASSPGRLQNVELTSAQSVVVPATATMGAIADLPFRLWIAAVMHGATFKIGVINPLMVTGNFAPTGTVSLDSTFEVYPLKAFGFTDAHGELDATAVGAGTLYYVGHGGVYRAYAVLGYLEYVDGLATPGSWGVPNGVTLWCPGMPLPGEVVRTYGTRAAAVATGATIVPFDDTIPQNTEGNLFMTATTGVSGFISTEANLLRVRASLNLASSNADTQILAALFLNSDVNACAVAVGARNGAAGFKSVVDVEYVGPNQDAAGALIQTVKARAGTLSAGTTTFNGAAGVRQFGGRMASQIVCEEIMT